MEEVDSIILHFLRQLDINIHEETKNIWELPVEVIIKSVSKCLLTINPSLKIPAQLPSGISHRIEVAALIASACKDLGYKNDVGYQTFLYFNEAELRQVIMFLIEKLPSEGKQPTVASVLPGNTNSLLMNCIKNKIAEELNYIWIPSYCNIQTQSSVGDYKYDTVSRPYKNSMYFSLEDITATLKVIEKDIFLKATHCTKADNIAFFEIDTNQLGESKVDQGDNRSLRELKEKSIFLRQKLDTLESEKSIMNVEYTKAQKSCERVEEELSNVQNILKNIGITDFNPEALINNLLQEVKTNIHMLQRKSEELISNSFLLKVEIDKIKSDMASSKSQRYSTKNILSNLKETAKSMKKELDKKKEDEIQSMKKYEKIKGNKRSIYTKRILEIINNVDKQNLEIQKILEDTKQLQKGINTLEGQLERCFSIADETLFRDAKKDDQAKKAYKLLALLHSECNTIVSLVNDTGALARDIVELEDNIKTESAKRVEDTLKKIRIDIIRIKEESSDM